MSVILDQIRKAERKASFNVALVARENRDKVPDELASDREKVERRQFLRDSLQDVDRADRLFERIIAGNELQDVNYLERGAVAARAVGRVAIRKQGTLKGWGTGFLIAPNVFITNHHVLPDVATANTSQAHFSYERDYNGAEAGPYIFTLEPERLFHTSDELDFTIVAVSEQAANSDVPLAAYGYLLLLEVTGKVADGEWLSIIQHPNGELKQVCVRENKLVKRTENELWYSTDTLGGSSGSPVFNNDWYVVALHHSGVARKVGNVVQTADGRDFVPGVDGEDRIDWIANEGIRVSRIVARLREQLPDHPLTQPLFSATPESARVGLFHTPCSPDLIPLRPNESTATAWKEQSSMNPPNVSPTGTVSVTLHIHADGTVSVGSQGYQEVASVETAMPERALPFDVPFDPDYATRRGYDPGFLGTASGLTVDLPGLSAALLDKAASLLNTTGGWPGQYVLDYHNYSVVMHAKRRLAIYSAANVSHAQRYKIGRPGDVWRMDPRLSEDYQIGNFYYKDNHFDRGHLTRREDLEYGATVGEALASAGDTCHWTNCMPQHERFNQGKSLWQGLELYVLEQTIFKSDLKVQVITGPVFEEDDPVYEPFPKIQYPVRFWKVLVALDTNGQAAATGYVLDQSEVIAQYGLGPKEAPPFGAYRTYQVTIAEIERLTQLTFTGTFRGTAIALRDYDPLNRATPRRNFPSFSARESTEVAAPPGYRLIAQLTDVVL